MTSAQPSKLHHQRITASALLCLTALGCGVAPPDGNMGHDPEVGDLESSAAPLTGGYVPENNFFNLAMYMETYSPTYDVTGWVGLCSGTYLGTVDGTAYATTAKHCTEPDEGEAPLTGFRVTTDSYPGRPWDRPPPISPPPNLAVPSSFLRASDLDQAVMTVPDDERFRFGLLNVNPSFRPGLTFMSPESVGVAGANLAGNRLQVYGYGSPELGVLKESDQFVYTGLRDDPRTIRIRSTGTDALGQGDSGGGILKPFAYYDKKGAFCRWDVLVAISVWLTGGGPATTSVAEMIQQRVGHLNLSPISNPNANVVLANGQTPRVSTDTTLPIKIQYHPSSKLLSDEGTGYCLSNTMRAVGCDSQDPAQQWEHTAELHLKNVATQTCLDPNGRYGYATRLRLVPCQELAEQAWVFHVGTN